MSIYYLMIKTHKITGLKYLCQTKKKDPYTYLGSGKYWKFHLKTHGKTIHTEILKECTSKDELRYWGTYYSNIWDVVKSNEWANLRPETGDGGPNFGPANGMYGKTHTERAIKSIKEKNTGKKLGTLKERYGKDKSDQMQNDRAESMRRARAENKEWGINLVKLSSTPEAIAKKSDKNHYRYNHTIYKWTNQLSGEVILATRAEFIKITDQFSSSISALFSGKIKQSRGWTYEIV